MATITEAIGAGGPTGFPEVLPSGFVQRISGPVGACVADVPPLEAAERRLANARQALADAERIVAAAREAAWNSGKALYPAQHAVWDAERAVRELRAQAP